jgi:hypothetical protein
MDTLFLLYKVIEGNSTFFSLYIINITSGHVSLVNVNPMTHVIVNYSLFVSPGLIFAPLSGAPTTFTLQGRPVEALESVVHGEEVLVSTNGVVLQKVAQGYNMTLVRANFPGVANDSFPDLSRLAGVRGGPLGLYLILRRFL